VLQARAQGKIDAEFVGLLSDKESPVLEVARSFGIPQIFLPMRSPRSTWDDEIFEVTEQFAPTLVVSLGFMRILSATYVERFQVINTHPSLLPLFPGAHAVRDALEAGVGLTGTTVHRVDAGLDTGPILKQREVKVLAGDIEATLHERIKIAERALIVEVLAEYGRTGRL
jgi:phosphoribosylglycinamide formyltransferase-1